MATSTPKKPVEDKPPPREAILIRMPKALFDKLEPLRNQGGYDTRNDAVVDALERAVKRVVRK